MRRTERPTSAGSPGCTRSRPTRPTSRPGPSPSRGSPAWRCSPGCDPQFRPDAVLVMSPPLTLGLPRLAAGPSPAGAVRVQHPGRVPRRRRRARRDHGLAGSSPPRRGSSGSCTGAADAVTVLSDDLRDNVAGQAGRSPPRAGRGDPELRRHRADRARDPRATPTADEYGLSDRDGRDVRRQRRLLAVGRPGGRAPPADWQRSDDVVFVDQRRRLGSRAELVAAGQGLDNLRLRRRCSRGSGCPRCSRPPTSTLVPLKEGLARSSVPSKLYSILAAGRPVPGQRRLRAPRSRAPLERAGAGVSVGPEDAECVHEGASTSWSPIPPGVTPMGADGPALGRAAGCRRRRWRERLRAALRGRPLERSRSRG